MSTIYTGHFSESLQDIIHGNLKYERTILGILMFLMFLWLHIHLVGELCEEDIDGINAWDNPMGGIDDSIMGETGWREFRGMGKIAKY